MDESRFCWICRGEFVAPCPESNDIATIDCRTCGLYTISGSLRASNFPLPDGERYRFSFWCKQRQLEHREPATLTAHSVGAITAQLPNPPTHAKADLLLRSLTLLYPTPGALFRIDTWRERSLACCATEVEDEMSFFIRLLVDRKYLAEDPHSSPGRFSITGNGWERAAKLAEQSTAASKTAFVAMWFSPDMLELWETAFKPAIKRAGFDPRLANDPQHNEQIDARIVADLKQCRFLVADVTGARTGVYFEAGFALGEKKPVIWTCQNRRQSDMHFDTRQYNHILWSDAADLENQLYYRIVATI
jgi:nucleoside 2-deoxyribosyltransferase